MTPPYYIDEELEPLPVLATRTIEGRQLQFALLPDRPGFRLSFTDRYPALLGEITALDTPTPTLTATESLHRSWVLNTGVAVTVHEIATFTWHHRTRLLGETS